MPLCFVCLLAASFGLPISSWAMGYGADLIVQENPFFFQESIDKLFFTEPAVKLPSIILLRRA